MPLRSHRSSRQPFLSVLRKGAPVGLGSGRSQRWVPSESLHGLKELALFQVEFRDLVGRVYRDCLAEAFVGLFVGSPSQQTYAQVVPGLLERRMSADRFQKKKFSLFQVSLGQLHGPGIV